LEYIIAIMLALAIIAQTTWTSPSEVFSSH